METLTYKFKNKNYELKKEENMKTKQKITTKPGFKEINWDNFKLFEWYLIHVKDEAETFLSIMINEKESLTLNKKHCFKIKKYEFKQKFLIKIFNDLQYTIYNLETKTKRNVEGTELIKMLGE